MPILSSEEATIPNENLRVRLEFLDGLHGILVTATTDRTRSRMVGIVKGAERLQALLAAADIDHYLHYSGDLLASPYHLKSVATPANPRQIVERLQRSFQKNDDIEMKILSGDSGKLTDEERHFVPPVHLTLCSSSVRAEEGIKRIEVWFSSKATKDAARRPGRSKR